MAFTRDLYPVLLPSGRGVLICELYPSEKDQVELLSGREIGPQGTVAEFNMITLKKGVLKMVKRYTVGKHQKQEELLTLDKKAWKEVDIGEMEENYDHLFSSKDDAVLCGLYRKLHSVSNDDIEAIAGKMQAVSEG